jgi:hypothetical protein
VSDLRPYERQSGTVRAASATALKRKWPESIGVSGNRTRLSYCTCAWAMHIRIIHPLSGTIDGIDLERFQIGQVYTIGTSLANYLMASGYALPVEDEHCALAALPNQQSRSGYLSDDAGRRHRPSRLMAPR